MTIGDISWGAVLVGAAAAVAFVSFAPAGISALASLGATMGNSTAAMVTMAAVGGIAGEFVSDLLHRCGNAISSVTSR